MTIPGVDYFVYYEPLPLSIKGMVTPNDDSTFSVYLNSRLPESCHRGILEHEVRHIENDDFYNDLPIEIVEGF